MHDGHQFYRGDEYKMPPLQRPDIKGICIYHVCIHCTKSAKLIWLSKHTAKCALCGTILERPNPDFSGLSAEGFTLEDLDTQEHADMMDKIFPPEFGDGIPPELLGNDEDGDEEDWDDGEE